jgi:stage V sporulation protein B
MQLILDSAALLLNAFITRTLGTSAIGILSLTGSFLVLVGTISNGNAFLCTSRLISEELGKPHGNPNTVLIHGISLCMILSISVSLILNGFADKIAERFFGGGDMGNAVRLMPLALIPSAIASCLKGYFNAMRQSTAAAVSDILEFASKSAVILISAPKIKNPSESSICILVITGIIAGSCISLVYLLIMFIRLHKRYTEKSSVNFMGYLSLAIPIMGGGILTSVLSSTNDALIPITLRQYGNSVNDALSSFGVFEAIVIPTIFFPSVVLCSLSGIIVSESARATASCNTERIRSITSRLLKYTMIFALFSAAVLIRYGNEIGNLMGGDELAGRMISIIAPVVPFIYLEIILESLIKGMGLQSFSSLNYLAEYTIRISVVLIFIPRIGFYGIVLSYYASNVIGNIARLVKIIRRTGLHFSIISNVLIPAVFVFMTMKTTELIMRIINADGDSVPEMICFTAVWGLMYTGIFVVDRRYSPNKRTYNVHEGNGIHGFIKETLFP